MRSTREFAIPSRYHSPFQRVAPGIYTLPGQSVGRVYVLEGEDGLTLVDTGLAWRSKNLLSLIDRSGRKVRDVRRVLLTHVHSDHLGGLRSLQANADLEVITMSANSAQLQGQIRSVADGDVIADVFGGVTVIGTPGHLPGHASFWFPERGVLFTGDTLASVGGLGILPSALQHNVGQVKHDVQRLARLEPSAICCGHGPPVTRDAASRLRDIGAAFERVTVFDAEYGATALRNLTNVTSRILRRERNVVEVTSRVHELAPHLRAKAFELAAS